ncbi:hypothetical protein [Teredinibacter sp. KSP-S5-2]|uniref:hypothetical protein n=1 Tax=Teredinibacter sp. KSP-S5-2 TaxID=3034506 RepID=UPI0029346838|nr:hypothetical protein [Teredinibacter sp. KSP-S5-2]WNO08269.1 hypothetical protein P5V12_14960 [Teredinibacter sp. KSP-S5-2]
MEDVFLNSLLACADNLLPGGSRSALESVLLDPVDGRNELSITQAELVARNYRVVKW